MQIIELRNYLLKDGATGDFIRYFEDHFLLSQREEGMSVLGQFAVEDEPHRFVWIRGFEDMPTRRRGLTGFYGGPCWQAHRSEANSMMLEFHNVHLLRSLGPLAALGHGLSLEDRTAEPSGVVPSHTRLVTVDFYRTKPGALPRLVELFEQRMQPALTQQSHQVRGHFVAELAPNDYPQLPVIQDASLLVVLSAYRDREDEAALRAGWRNSDAWRTGLREEVHALLAADVETIRLRPTARSLIRYRSQED